MSRGLGLQEAASVIMVGAAHPTGEMNFEDATPFLARIGLADVREFGLTWNYYYDYLHKLGYDIKVELLEVK